MRYRAFPFAMFLAAAPAIADACVKIRDGTDGNGASGGLTCMTFGRDQVRAAASLGIRLEGSYKSTRAQMFRSGWAIDFDSLVDPRGDGSLEPPACGSGYDAVCQVRMTKGKAAVWLTFSGTNTGFPLISVEAE